MDIHVLTSCLNMVGRAPLIPLILAGNSTPTSPHQYSKHKRPGSVKLAVPGKTTTSVLNDITLKLFTL